MFFVYLQCEILKYNNNNNMNAEEARLYANTTLMANLCLIGDNDELDEITIGEDGKMIVKYTQPIQLEEDGEFVDCEYRVKGITKIIFK